jgi:hypothetical protein
MDLQSTTCDVGLPCLSQRAAVLAEVTLGKETKKNESRARCSSFGTLIDPKPKQTFAAMAASHHASFAAEQPVDLSYVTKGRGIPQTGNLSEDKQWVKPLPSCAVLPPLPRAEAVNPEDYLGQPAICDCCALHCALLR